MQNGVASPFHELWPGNDVGRLLSANLRSVRIHPSQQSKGVFLPRPSFERQAEAFASLSNVRFGDLSEV
jgi:hypothetical protein